MPRRARVGAHRPKRVVFWLWQRDERLAQRAADGAEASVGDASAAVHTWRSAVASAVGAQMEATDRLIQALLASMNEEMRLLRVHADLVARGPALVATAARARQQAPEHIALDTRIGHWLALWRQWSAMAEETMWLPAAADLPDLIENVSG